MTAERDSIAYSHGRSSGRGDSWGKIIDGHKEIECEILNLNATGCKIRTETPLDVPVIFSFSILNTDTITDAEIIWSRGREYGIRFLSKCAKNGVSYID